MSERKTYLITATSGIGAETAKQLALMQACIYFVGLDHSRSSEFSNTLVQLGAECAFFEGDLTDPLVAPAAVQDCVEHFGRIDALFNVAGISGRRYGDGPLHECTEEGWQKTLQTNATTQYRMSREVVRIMLAQNAGKDGLRGTILNMSSVLAVDPDARHFSAIAYAASKAAVIAMSRSMAAYYAANRIRVNVIAPGLVRTAMSERASTDPEILEYMRFRQPLLADTIPVEDVAATCVHLLTDASRSMTGQVIQVDAGWSVA